MAPRTEQPLKNKYTLLQNVSGKWKTLRTFSIHFLPKKDCSISEYTGHVTFLTNTGYVSSYFNRGVSMDENLKVLIEERKCG